MTIYTSWAMNGIKTGKIVKHEKAIVRNGMKHPERMVYRDTETGELMAKINGEFWQVRQYNGRYSFR